MALTLRLAQVTDLPSIYLGEQDYIRTWEHAHEAAWQNDLHRHLTRWVAHFERLTVALINEQFAGYSLWAPTEHQAELCTINVSPRYRRSGIGRALLARYSADAAQSGFSRLVLSVREDNPARLMYEQSGFACTGTDRHGYLRFEKVIPAQV